MTRYPVQALLDAIGAPTIRAAAQHLGISATGLHRHRERGLTAETADRYAVAAGLHPAMVWPSFIDDGLSVLDRMFLDGGWRQSWLYAQGMVA